MVPAGPGPAPPPPACPPAPPPALRAAFWGVSVWARPEDSSIGPRMTGPFPSRRGPNPREADPSCPATCPKRGAGRVASLGGFGEPATLTLSDSAPHRHRAAVGGLRSHARTTLALRSAQGSLSPPRTPGLRPLVPGRRPKALGDPERLRQRPPSPSLSTAGVVRSLSPVPTSPHPFPSFPPPTPAAARVSAAAARSP
ncbi:histone-lysine N-methyltransferase 2B-like [Cervus elaphus]|uniref:histone-lysine N-methyltransferase 2B-like n=1 Tax=Cervus elaphus TaxID=9860 RepID=UPI001CC2F2A1|nr:histone-lysine N-methyltransferase 2B-like [Cervus elaphus]